MHHVCLGTLSPGTFRGSCSAADVRENTLSSMIENESILLAMYDISGCKVFCGRDCGHHFFGVIDVVCHNTHGGACVSWYGHHRIFIHVGRFVFRAIPVMCHYSDSTLFSL